MPSRLTIGISLPIQPPQVHFVKAHAVPFAAMVRRSFRIGLRLGLLFGVTLALVKTVQARRTASAVPPPAPWEPIVDEPRADPARYEPPVRAAAVVDEPVDEVGEPILEPSEPEPEEEPEAVDIPTPPEEDLLHAKVETVDDDILPDPALDIVPEATEVTAPVKKVAAKKLPAAKKAAAPRKRAARKADREADAPGLPGFVEPEGGTCPPTHPVKAKLASRLFHLPGMFAYDRTRPDRCYLDAPSAVADGFTSAKR